MLLWGRTPNTSLLGMRAATIAQKAFNGKLQPSEILKRHTLVPFYSNFLDPRAAVEFEKAVTLGISNPPSIYLFGAPLISTAGLRICSDCVADDLARDGFGYYHLKHQLAFSRVCLKHGRILLGTCPVCHCTLQGVSSSFMPGDPCRKCGATLKSDLVGNLSRGEFQLLTIAEHLCVHSEIWLTPLHWHDVMGGLVQRHGDIPGAVRYVKDLICERWSVKKTEDLSKISSCELSKTFVEDEILQRAMPGRDLYGRLIVFEAVSSETAGPNVQAQMAAEFAAAQDPKLRSLVSAACAQGLPPAIGRMILDGHASAKICAALPMNPLRLKKLTDSLPLSAVSTTRTCNVLPGATASARLHDRRPMTRKLARKVIEDSLATTTPVSRVGEIGLRKRALDWLRRNEPEWLDKAIPRLTGNAVLDRQTREKHREVFTAYIAAQAMVPQIHQILRTTAGSWLYRNDTEWFDEHRPKLRNRTRHFRGSDDRKRTYRAEAKALVRQDKTLSRSDVRLILCSKWSWLVKNDREWTDRLLPAKSQFGIKRPRKRST